MKKEETAQKAPRTPAEWLESLKAQREQLRDQINQVAGAIALAEQMIAEGNTIEK